METYRGEPYQDTLLVGWWTQLVNTGEIRDIFHRDLWALGAFMAYWRGSERTLILIAGSTSDGHSIYMYQRPWACAWFEPMMDGAAIGLWLDSSVRKSKAGLQALELFHEAGFRRWPVLVALTRQERLLRPAERLGYTVVGQVPHIWGDAVWISYVTQEAFVERICHRKGTVKQADQRDPRPGPVGVH